MPSGVPDYFYHLVFLLDATSGNITMSPTLDQWGENLNFESRDPNPYRLYIMLRGKMTSISVCE